MGRPDIEKRMLGTRVDKSAPEANGIHDQKNGDSFHYFAFDSLSETIIVSP